MKIEFILKYKDYEEQVLREKFCEFIVNSIKYDIINNTNYSKLCSKSLDVLKLSWIDWIVKPLNINMKIIVEKISDSVTFSIRKDGVCSIYLRRDRFIPRSNTKLERLARFLDKGDRKTRGTYFLSSVFRKYEENMQSNWKKYISIKLRKFDISNSVIVR